MAEVEFGELKVSGGKLLLVIPFLGSIGAALWGGFELYQRLLTAEEAIVSYVSPDFSSYDEELADLGDHAEERIEAVGLFVDQIVPQESHLRETIDDFCSTSEGIQVVELLMAQMQQTPFLDGTQPVQVLNEAKLKEMMQDPRYYGHNKDMDFVRKVDEGFRKIYG